MKRQSILLLASLAAGLLLGAWPPVSAQAAVRHHAASARTRAHHGHYVTLTVDHAPVRVVLQILFRHSGRNYVLGPRIDGTITASLRHVPFDAAVAQIVGANSVPLTETQSNGVYVIKVRPPAAPVAQAPAVSVPTFPVRRPVYPAPVATPPQIILPGTSGTVRVVP